MDNSSSSGVPPTSNGHANSTGASDDRAAATKGRKAAGKAADNGQHQQAVAKRKRNKKRDKKKRDKKKRKVDKQSSVASSGTDENSNALATPPLTVATPDSGNDSTEPLDFFAVQKLAHAAVARAQARGEAARAERAARQYPRLIKRPRKRRRNHSADAGQNLPEPAAAEGVPDLDTANVSAGDEQWTPERIAQFAAEAVARAQARGKRRKERRA